MTIVSRTTWGAREPKTPAPTLTMPVKRIAIHHTGGRVGATAGPQVMRNLQSYAMRSRLLGGKALNDLQYHFVIDPRDGVIYQGRANAWRDTLAVGAHTPGHNHESVALCVLGDWTDPKVISDDLLRNNAIVGMAKAVQFLRWINAATWDADLVPHGHFSKLPHSTTYATSCPGMFQELLGWVLLVAATRTS